MLHEIVSALLDCFSQIWFILLALLVAWLVIKISDAVAARKAAREKRKRERAEATRQAQQKIDENERAQAYRSLYIKRQRYVA